MNRTIYLLKYPSQPRQRGHFAIWIPSHDDHKAGKIIQVLGTPFTGFNLDIQLHYDLREAQPKPVLIELGLVGSEVVTDNNVSQLSDPTSADKLETGEICDPSRTEPESAGY